jgi:hypothetical protein
MFAAAHETMTVGLPYDGPEAQAAERSVRGMFEDMSSTGRPRGMLPLVDLP